MTKIKKNRIDSEALLKKKALQGVKKPNPFEIQTNRSKFTILNRDTKSNRIARIPGVQSARAIEKRKQTLAQEYVQKNKSNRFKDDRKDGRNMSRDQIMVERKSMGSRRKELFNLNDNVTLTHKGQTLEEIERFDDAVDNDDSDEDGGQLDAEFMEAAHFGGGNEDGENRGKDRKTVIEEMIAESKRRKAEKQRENDEVYEMTQKLDQNWQSLISVVGDHMKGDPQRPQLDDYDKIMREMIFERRGQPADKLKSEEELVKREQLKLEKLERERLARMKDEDTKTTQTHRSADDLDDGYLLNMVDVNGESLNNEGEIDAEDGLYNPLEISKEAREDSNDEKSECENNDLDSGSETESESESEDQLSDLKGDSESDSEEELAKFVSNESKETKTYDVAKPTSGCDGASLPFTFVVPRTYEQFREILDQHTPFQQIVVLERMINSNKADRVNKPRMLSLFAFVIQYMNDIFTDVKRYSIRNSFRMLYDVTPYLYDLAKINPTETSKCFLEVLQEKVDEYHKRPRRYPPLDSLIFLKLVPVLYSPTDFRHPVVTPALTFISELLSRCAVKSRTDVTCGIFLVTIALECTEHSKRFLPAALNFLNGILYMCFLKRSVNSIPVVPPFKSTTPFNNLLALDEMTEQCIVGDLYLNCEDFVNNEIDSLFKLTALNSAFHLIARVCKQLSDLPALHQITINLLESLERIDEDYLPSALKHCYDETLKIVKMHHSRSLSFLMAPEQKPKPLRLLEPRIEAVYDDIQRRPKNQDQVDKQKRKKLRQKVKKEYRAAAREIRQDNEFIAKLQFKKRAASDRERRDRVKRIFADATSQQGELNSLDRKAKYKK